jgi:5-(carboxyamino)imidazole ribonucleotide synthase
MTTIGVIGYGQLGRMLAIHGLPLGIEFRFWDMRTESYFTVIPPHPHATASGSQALEAFLAEVDVVTFETENVPLALVEQIARKKAVVPNAKALAVCQNRLAEKRLCQQLNIPTAPFCELQTESDLQGALDELSGEIFVKTVTLGYDGKGQRRVSHASQVNEAWTALQGQSLIAEKKVAFQFECSLIIARDSQKKSVFYPLIMNEHHAGILYYSQVMTAAWLSRLQSQAEQIAEKLLAYFDYQGVLTIEFFVDEQGQLLVNELAPRVHNSGHLTIEGFDYSQFEQHVRALIDFPTHTPTLRYAHVAMINIIGQFVEPQKILQFPAAHLHWYGKSVQPNRKVGHITVATNDAVIFSETVAAIKKLVLPVDG